ncbi:MAG: hypothetical protein ABIZ80_09120 [Bryobacteraceae bacterium]
MSCDRGASGRTWYGPHQNAGGEGLLGGEPSPVHTGMHREAVLIEFDFEGETVRRLGLPDVHRHGRE